MLKRPIISVGSWIIGRPKHQTVMPQGKQRHARREVAVDQSSMIGRQRCHPKDGDAIMLTKRNALLAAGAAALAAVAGDRAASAADANWFQNCCGSIPSEAVPGGHDANGDTLYFCRVWASAGYQPGKVSRSLGTCNFPYVVWSIRTPTTTSCSPTGKPRRGAYNGFTLSSRH